MDFKLRKWEKSDVAFLVKYANNWEIARKLTDQFPHPYGEDDARKFLEMAMNIENALLYAIDIGGEAVGSIGIFQQNDIHRLNAEMGYWLAEDFWGKGIITTAITQMVTLGFEKFEIQRIFARPFGSNLASQRVLLKAGFRLEASFEKVLLKNGKMEDELIFGFRKGWIK